jgi:hypothetical protein
MGSFASEERLLEIAARDLREPVEELVRGETGARVLAAALPSLDRTAAVVSNYCSRNRVKEDEPGLRDACLAAAVSSLLRCGRLVASSSAEGVWLELTGPGRTPESSTAAVLDFLASQQEPQPLTAIAGSVLGTRDPAALLAGPLPLVQASKLLLKQRKVLEASPGRYSLAQPEKPQ